MFAPDIPPTLPVDSSMVSDVSSPWEVVLNAITFMKHQFMFITSVLQHTNVIVFFFSIIALKFQIDTFALVFVDQNAKKNYKLK